MGFVDAMEEHTGKSVINVLLGIIGYRYADSMIKSEDGVVVTIFFVKCD